MRTKICITVLIIFIPLLILETLNIINGKHHNIEYELNVNQSFSKAVSAAYLNHINGIWNTELASGEYAVSMPTLEKGEIAACMKRIASKQKAVRSYNIISPDGTFLAGSLDNSEVGNLLDSKLIDRIKNGEEKVISGITGGIHDKDIVFTVNRGIWKNGEIKLIVVAVMDAGKIGEILPAYEIVSTGSYGIIDGNGMIVYSSINPDIPFGSRRIKYDSPAWDALNGKDKRIYGYKSSFHDLEYIGTIVPIPEIGWASFASISLNEVDRKYGKEVASDITILAVTTVVSLITALAAVDRFLEPVNILKNASHSISQGNFMV